MKKKHVMCFADIIVNDINNYDRYYAESKHHSSGSKFSYIRVERCFSVYDPFVEFAAIYLQDTGLLVKYMKNYMLGRELPSISIPYVQYDDKDLIGIMEGFPFHAPLGKSAGDAIVRTFQDCGSTMITCFKEEWVFLSNFFPCNVEFEGIVFPSSEHAFQAAKTLDLDRRREIAALGTAGKAKRAGRQSKIRDDWDDIRIDVMRKILVAKFSDPELRRLLDATKPLELIEGNNWGDRFWGAVGGKGNNHLGKLLMSIRDE